MDWLEGLQWVASVEAGPWIALAAAGWGAAWQRDKAYRAKDREYQNLVLRLMEMNAQQAVAMEKAAGSAERLADLVRLHVIGAPK